MAKLSSINKNNRRIKLSNKFYSKRKKLKEHIFTQPDRPKDIPYRTSYYSEKWGFCMSHEQFLKLEDGVYKIIKKKTQIID